MCGTLVQRTILIADGSKTTILSKLRLGNGGKLLYRPFAMFMITNREIHEFDELLLS